MTCSVYWLFNDRCFCPWKHGYIGVTVNLRNRLKLHRAAKDDFQHRILFQGSEDECYALEEKMRPLPFIAWNVAPGGLRANGHPRSAETRKKMKEASVRRYTDPQERIKMSEALKGRKITWGAKVAATKRGTKLSDATRAKMSAVRKGKFLRGPFSDEHRANLSATKKGMKMPWVAEANRRRKSCPLV